MPGSRSRGAGRPGKQDPTEPRAGETDALWTHAAAPPQALGPASHHGAQRLRQQGGVRHRAGPTDGDGPLPPPTSQACGRPGSEAGGPRVREPRVRAGPRASRRRENPHALAAARSPSWRARQFAKWPGKGWPLASFHGLKVSTTGQSGRAAARARPGCWGTAPPPLPSPEREGSGGSCVPAPARGGVRGRRGVAGAWRGRARSRVPAAPAPAALSPGARRLWRPHHGVAPRGVRAQRRPAPRLARLPGRLGKPRSARAAVRSWPAPALSGPRARCSPGTWGRRRLRAASALRGAGASRAVSPSGGPGAPATPAGARVRPGGAHAEPRGGGAWAPPSPAFRAGL